MPETLRDELHKLLTEAGQAHHEAFVSTGGKDEDWPIWYADRLLEPLQQLLGVSLSRSQLIYCLMDADYEHSAMSPDSPWAEYYTNHLLEHYAPSNTPARDKLALYHFVGCPFCSIAREPIERLGVDVELRDIYENPHFLDELVKARGRATVPVLRITSPSGEDHWMPESRDIVQYIESTYG